MKGNGIVFNSSIPDDDPRGKNRIIISLNLFFLRIQFLQKNVLYKNTSKIILTKNS